MKIELKTITVRDLVKDYKDNKEGGVVGFGGKLDIRPPYQREYIYNDKQRDAVINTITEGFPLNVMYWSAREDGNFEIIDGQQRTISICQYTEGDFSFNDLYFYNLKDDEKEKLLNYKLMIYHCSGSSREKLKWFETINIAGAELRSQELKNAVYSGSWVSSARTYFSKTGCAAYGIGRHYLAGIPIRQDYLETVIGWKSNGDIKGYMGKHQHAPDAEELWLYFKNIVEWIERNFTKRRKEMKSVEWGPLFDEFKNTKNNPAELEKEIKRLMEDEDVTNKKGIYPYVLTKKEKHLNIRLFSPKQKREAYERQEGICPVCEKHFEIEDMEGDHITPWHLGGPTTAANCKMLCKEHNRQKSGK